MARTRQKRKAKQRQQQQQQQATRRDASAKQQPSNPAEAAVIQHAEATETADELEELVEQDQVVEEPPQEVVEVEEQPRAEPTRQRAAEERKPARRERKAAPEKRKEPRKRGRVVNFLIQVWAELRRVQWPDRNQVTQATGVVIVFCFLAGAFLAFWDFVFGELITSIL